MPSRAVRLTVPVLAALLLVAAACGSASSAGSPSSRTAATSTAKTASPRPAQRLTAAQIAHTRVAAMVLATESLPGYKLHSKGGETLKDQLPPKRIPHAAVIERLVRRNWIASEHSLVVAPDGRLYVQSDVNLFRTGAAAARISNLEAVVIPGVHEKMYSAPAGAPLGAELEFASSRKLSAFTLDWTQGPVIAYVRIFGHPHETFTPAQEHRIAAYLAGVATAEAARIAHVEALGNVAA